MRAAIENFRDMKVERRMAILGDMGELGDCSWKAHQAIADLLVESGFEHVVGGAEVQGGASSFPVRLIMWSR